MEGRAFWWVYLVYIWYFLNCNSNWCFSLFRVILKFLIVLVFNDGTARDLVNLQGTIPVNYKGNIQSK